MDKNRQKRAALKAATEAKAKRKEARAADQKTQMFVRSLPQGKEHFRNISTKIGVDHITEVPEIEEDT